MLTEGPDAPGADVGLEVTVPGGVGVGPALGVTVDREMKISAIPTMTKTINE